MNKIFICSNCGTEYTGTWNSIKRHKNPGGSVEEYLTCVKDGSPAFVKETVTTKKITSQKENFAGVVAAEILEISEEVVEEKPKAKTVTKKKTKKTEDKA